MTDSDWKSIRTEVLLELVNLRLPVDALASKIRELPWDSQDDLVAFSTAQVLHAIELFDQGKILASDLYEWAELIDGREDVGFAGPLADDLRQFIFEVSCPEFIADPQEMLRTWKTLFIQFGAN